MAQTFRSSPQGITAHFSDDEAELLRKLADDVILALEPSGEAATDPLAAMIGISESVEAPSDPALARLLPVASDDPEVADEYRRYTELDLRQQKIANLQLVSYDLEKRDITLDEGRAHAWAAALNDIRLLIGTRLGIESDEDSARIARVNSVDEVETLDEYMSVIYNFLTWLQDTLMEALLLNLEATMEDE